MTDAQKARMRRYERLRTQYEDIHREHPGSTNAQVLEEMARRGCGGEPAAGLHPCVRPPGGTERDKGAYRGDVLLTEPRVLQPGAFAYSPVKTA